MSTPKDQLRKALDQRTDALAADEAATIAVWDQQRRVQREQKRLTARKAAVVETRRAVEAADAEVLAAAEEIGR